MHVFCLHVNLCSPWRSGAQGGQNTEGIESPRIGITGNCGHYVGAENQTQFPWLSSQYLYPMDCFSSPQSLLFNFFISMHLFYTPVNFSGIIPHLQMPGAGQTLFFYPSLRVSFCAIHRFDFSYTKTQIYPWTFGLCIATNSYGASGKL